MSALDPFIAAVRAMPSPEGCGCKARKERLIAWLENPANPMRKALATPQPQPASSKKE